MAKKKTEDELKATIAKQNGELQKLKRQLEEMEDTKNDAVSETDIVQQRLDDTRIRGKNELEVRNQHRVVKDYQHSIQLQRNSLLLSMEKMETAKLAELHAKRRIAFELDLTGRMPYVNLSLNSF